MISQMNEQPELWREELLLATEYVRPDGEIGEALAAIWQRVLNIDCVGLHDDFFEIGGDSLGASVIAGEIESRFGCRFSPSQLVDASTVSAQTAYIEKRKQSVSTLPSNLIACHAEGKKTPLFIVHGAVGFTIYDKRFLEGMDKDRPVIFIEAPGLDGKAEPLETIEAIAAHYLGSMRQIAPEGNWMLAANCAGGLIAMEICKQADRSGENVGRLMLVDPMPKIFKKASKVRMWRGKKKLRSVLPPRIRSFLKSFPPFLRRGSAIKTDKYERSLDFRQQQQARLDARIRMRVGEQQAALVASGAAYSADAMRAVSRSLGKAFRGYAPSLWDGPAFVLTSDPRKEGVGILSSYLPNARFRVVPYHHGSLFVEGLSEILKFFNDAMSPDAGNTFL